MFPCYHMFWWSNHKCSLPAQISLLYSFNHPAQSICTDGADGENEVFLFSVLYGKPKGSLTCRLPGMLQIKYQFVKGLQSRERPPYNTNDKPGLVMNACHTSVSVVWCAIICHISPKLYTYLHMFICNWELMRVNLSSIEDITCYRRLNPPWHWAALSEKN